MVGGGGGGPASGVAASAIGPTSDRMHVVTSAGQTIEVPSHISSGSQEVSVEARQERPASATRSGGHSGAEPQISGASQVSRPARHSVPIKNSATQSAEVPAQ